MGNQGVNARNRIGDVGNAENEEHPVGVQGISVEMQEIGVRIQKPRVGMRETGVGMRGIMVGRQGIWGGNYYCYYNLYFIEICCINLAYRQ